MKSLKKSMNQEPDVRLAARLPASVHDDLRKVAKRERLSVNQTLVRACEEFCGSPRVEQSQQLRDLTEICKVLGANGQRRLKRALVERLNVLYHLNIPPDLDEANSDVQESAEAQIQD
jgi:hypothetical protein